MFVVKTADKSDNCSFEFDIVLKLFCSRMSTLAENVPQVIYY